LMLNLLWYDKLVLFDFLFLHVLWRILVFDLFFDFLNKIFLLKINILSLIFDLGFHFSFLSFICSLDFESL